MMHLFDFGSRSRRGDSAQSGHPRTPCGRRLDRRARKLLAACCAALAVLCTLECVVTATATRRVLTAAHQIQAGDAVVTADFTMTALPANDALSDAVDALDDETAYALIDIREGDVLLPTMLGRVPAVAPGHTVIDVRLGELSRPFSPGTHIRLTAATGCSPPAAETAGNGDAADAAGAANESGADDAAGTDSGGASGRGAASKDAAGRTDTGGRTDTVSRTTDADGRSGAVGKQAGAHGKPDTDGTTADADDATAVGATADVNAGAAVGANARAAADTNPEADAAADATIVADGLCTVSDDAIIMGPPRDDVAGDGHLTPVAMSAADAMRTLQAQTNGPILAVRADD